MFKRGDVVQHADEKRIGVVTLDGKDGLIVKWFEGRTGGGLVDRTLVTPIDGYEFEAALALGDTAKVLDLYRAAQASLVQVEHERDALRDELDVTDKLYSETRRVVQAIPECSIHGECVPHALEWVEESKRLRREHKALFLSLPVPNTKAAAYQIFVEINGERYEFKDFSMLQKVDDTDASTADEGDPI